MTTDTKTNRVAIVTGGSGGIGRQTAERLAADGMAVVVCYAGNPGPAKDAVAAIEDGGGTAMAARPTSPTKPRSRRCSTRPSRPTAGWTSWCTPPGSCCCRRWPT